MFGVEDKHQACSSEDQHQACSNERRFFLFFLFLLRCVSALFALGFCSKYFASPNIAGTHFKVFITGCVSGEPSRAVVGLRSSMRSHVKAPRFVRRYFSYAAAITATTEGKIVRCRSALLTPAIPRSISCGAESNFSICLKCSVQICLSCDPSNHQNPAGEFV